MLEPYNFSLYQCRLPQGEMELQWWTKGLWITVKVYVIQYDLVKDAICFNNALYSPIPPLQNKVGGGGGSGDED